MKKHGFMLYYLLVIAIQLLMQQIHCVHGLKITQMDAHTVEGAGTVAQPTVPAQPAVVAQGNREGQLKKETKEGKAAVVLVPVPVYVQGSANPA